MISNTLEIKDHEDMQKLIESNYSNLDTLIPSINLALDNAVDKDERIRFCELLSERIAILDQFGQAISQDALKRRFEDNEKEYENGKDMVDLSEVLWEKILGKQKDYMALLDAENLAYEKAAKEREKNQTHQNKQGNTVNGNCDFDDDIPF